MTLQEYYLREIQHTYHGGFPKVCPKCGKEVEWLQLKNRPYTFFHKESNFKVVGGRFRVMAFKCGYKIHPLVKTPFEKSTIHLAFWFEMITEYKEQRPSIYSVCKKYGIAYKTAHRIYHLIKNNNLYEKFRYIYV